MSAPVSYQEALAAAAATRAAQQTITPAQMAAAAGENVIATRERAAEYAKKLLRRLWATVNPYDEKQVDDFAKAGVKILATAQTATGRAAAAAVSVQLQTMGIKIDATPSLPIDVRAPAAVVKNGTVTLQRRDSVVKYDNGDTRTVTASDMTTEAVLKRPAAGFRWIQAEEGTDAAERSGLRIDQIVEDQVMLAQRFAETEALAQAVDLDTKTPSSTRPKVIGYRRVIHPELSRSGVCGLCIAASDRVYKVGELRPIHANCKCTIAPVTEDHDPADDLNKADLAAVYSASGGTSGAHLKRTRYKVDDHGELGPVLVPEKPYKRRGQKRNAAPVAAAPKSREEKVDIAARHLPVLEKSLADLRARGVAEDSGPVTWHKEQIARMQADSGKSLGNGPAPPIKNVETNDKAAGGGGKPPKPPTQSTTAVGGDDPADRLNTAFADQTAAATADQRSSAQRWQGLGRYYDEVQAAVVDPDNASEDALDVASDLQQLARPLPEDAEVWRGIRSIEDSFGTGIDEVAGRDVEVVARFLSTSVYEQVARDEFTTPGRNPAILKITARAGTPAVWMPPLGDSAMSYQGELLFQPGCRLRIVNVDRSGDVPLIEVEVSR
jgi:hypothetical protein